MTPQQEEIVRHTLGLFVGNVSHRNYFCAGDDHDDMPVIQELIALGFMRLSHRINEGRDGIYVVTGTGEMQLPPFTRSG